MSNSFGIQHDCIMAIQDVFVVCLTSMEEARHV